MTEEALWSTEVRTAVDQVRRVLFKILDDLDGDKTMVWDNAPNFMKRVNLITGPKLLANHGVNFNRKLEDSSHCSTPYLVFMLFPTVASLDGLCNFIDKCKNDMKTLYVVIFIPEASYIVKEKLKERDGGRYWERLEAVKEVPFWWLPRDGDCLSLNEPQLPSRQLINGDWTYMHRCAMALNQFLNQVPGRIPLYSKGDWAINVAKIVAKMRVNEEEGPSAGGIRINRVVIIDRWLDPLTPLLTQLTYSGLLDELYGVGMMGSIKVPLTEFEEKSDLDPFEMKEIYLNDDIYYRLRHIHVNAIAGEFGAILSELKKDEIGEDAKNSMSIAEYKVLVKKLPEINKKKKNTSTHMRLAEMIKEELYESIVDRVKVEKDLLDHSNSERVLQFIEDSILDALDLTTVLRLIAIHSLTSGGLKPVVLTTYRRLIMQSYGAEAVNKMLKMQKMGLLREKTGSGKLACERSPFLFSQMKKTYDLLVEEVRESDIKNPAYAYSGYCSLLVKMLAQGDSVRWADWKKDGEHGGLDDDKTAVFVVGGVSRAELALIRQISNVCLVMTSGLVTGNIMIESLTRI